MRESEPWKVAWGKAMLDAEARAMELPDDSAVCSTCAAVTCELAVGQALMEEGWSTAEQLRVGREVKDLVEALLPQEGEPCGRHRLKKEDYE